MVRALRLHLSDITRFAVPRGGMSIWCRAEKLNVEKWAARCLAAGVRFRTARWFTFDGHSRPAFRLGFGGLSESQTDAAVQVMRTSARR